MVYTVYIWIHDCNALAGHAIVDNFPEFAVSHITCLQCQLFIVTHDMIYMTGMTYDDAGYVAHYWMLTFRLDRSVVRAAVCVIRYISLHLKDLKPWENRRRRRTFTHCDGTAILILIYSFLCLLKSAIYFIKFNLTNYHPFRSRSYSWSPERSERPERFERNSRRTSSR